jgi:MPBQ/MSBQ methyltransferase
MTRVLSRHEMPGKVIDANLTSAEMALVRAHLRDQYLHVFDERMIAAHIQEFVESSFADNLARVVAAGSRAGEALLDIGSGYGAFVLACRRHGMDAMGFELSDFEVEISRRRLARAEPEADGTMVFPKGDAGVLPFVDNSFQIVTLLNVLEHVPDYRAVLAEAVRVLRPGGRLLVICPNYAALRQEAHYHVPWVPFFPRGAAIAYLRLLGRNPEFFRRHIYYCTNWGVLRALRRLGMRAYNLDLLRLEDPELFSSRNVKLIVNFIRRARLLPIVKLIVQFSFYNPFKKAVAAVADKKLGAAN